jgi:RNA polymerase sigma factor (sigma-70 family)
LVEALASADPQSAWEEFLQTHGAVLLRVVRLFENDADRVSDAFVFVCEHLAAGRFRRLCKFRPGGEARFSTWLAAVTRNLCIDWHRRECGRHRVFRSVARLSAFDQQVFRLVFQQRCPVLHALAVLRGAAPGTREEEVEESVARIQSSLSPRQVWLLTLSRDRPDNLGIDDAPAECERAPDPRPDPEKGLAMAQQEQALAHALAKLPKADRLLVRLRFEQGLTLKRVAQLANCGSAETAYRRISSILRRLRADMESRPEIRESNWLGVRVSK